MNADDVIESYVTDVAVRLPRKQRNDVAFELRVLLNEELQAKADAIGRVAHAEMAIELLRDFGAPADVAARYLPTLIIIDPADGHKFFRATVVGLAVIWCIGLLERLRQPVDSGSNMLNVLGQWWGSAVIPSLWWPGVLVVGFAAASWSRRRWPQTSDWKPRATDSISGGRAGIVFGLFGIVCALYVLVEPRWILDFFWGGHAAPAAYQALTYTDTFLQLQAPVLFALVVLNIPLNIILIVSGRRSATMRRIELALALLTCAAMVWAVAGAPILMSPNSDQTAKVLLTLIVALVLLIGGIKMYRNVRPTPDRQLHAL